MSSARIKIKTARDLLTASVWGRCGGKHTLFEIALPCIVNAGGFRVRFWRFYYWKTAVCAWCCFLVCQDYSCRSGATATVTSQWYVFLPNEMCFPDPGTHITRDMCSGEHMSRAREPLLSRGLGTVRRYFVLRTRELYYIFNNSKLKILFKVAPWRFCIVLWPRFYYSFDAGRFNHSNVFPFI